MEDSEWVLVIEAGTPLSLKCPVETDSVFAAGGQTALTFEWLKDSLPFPKSSNRSSILVSASLPSSL